MRTKRCYCCKISLPADQFAKNAAKPDGLREECRTCRKYELAVRGANSRAQEYGLPGRLKIQDIRHLMGFFEPHGCIICGSSFADRKQLSLDHVVPFKRGGRNETGNLLPICLHCNANKGDKPLLIFAAERITWDRVESLLRFLAYENDQTAAEVAAELAEDVLQYIRGD
ncbi:HNH endonuclease signature motif containing protein [Bacillus sp. AG4(2022)]|uniref:HNH endonuclease signature motif containing protein n=1 Tax=Bacillus sp. AG4(2022) TaxID=2962594 RepID=UPI002880CC3E|nr:HNH endonuclease signature motif containing protein [Bacillus sp. AG4(2022)]MDT0161863.1 HNH endonuclease signature motif containing protein [Bacillus sp. AG4(2022)]